MPHKTGDSWLTHKEFDYSNKTGSIGFIFLLGLLALQVLQGWCAAACGDTVHTVGLCHNSQLGTQAPQPCKEKTSKPVQPLSQRKTLSLLFLVNKRMCPLLCREPLCLHIFQWLFTIQAQLRMLIHGWKIRGVNRNTTKWLKNSKKQTREIDSQVIHIL